MLMGNVPTIKIRTKTFVGHSTVINEVQNTSVTVRTCGKKNDQKNEKSCFEDMKKWSIISSEEEKDD